MPANSSRGTTPKRFPTPRAASKQERLWLCFIRRSPTSARRQVFKHSSTKACHAAGTWTMDKFIDAKCPRYRKTGRQRKGDMRHLQAASIISRQPSLSTKRRPISSRNILSIMACFVKNDERFESRPLPRPFQNRSSESPAAASEQFIGRLRRHRSAAENERSSAASSSTLSNVSEDNQGRATSSRKDTLYTA